MCIMWITMQEINQFITRETIDLSRSDRIVTQKREYKEFYMENTPKLSTMMEKNMDNFWSFYSIW